MKDVQDYRCPFLSHSLDGAGEVRVGRESGIRVELAQWVATLCMWVPFFRSSSAINRSVAGPHRIDVDRR